MKTLMLLTIVSVALAAPALPEEATDHLEDLEFQKQRSIPELVKRENKSPSELQPTTVLHSGASNTEIDTDVIPIQTGRSFALKTPVIVKKKHGYHLYRDSEEEKANADSHEQCGRQVKVKLCDGDGKFREMLRSAGHEISDSTSENDMKHSIMMAREAIENLQRDFKKIEEKSVSGKLDLKPDTDLHEDIEVTRQALEDIHKNFENLETMSLHATALRDSDALQDLHIRIANTEEEKMAQWKAAIENIHKNVEIAQNIENSLKTANDQEKLSQFDAPQMPSTKTDYKMKEKFSNSALREDNMLEAQSDSFKTQSVENINDMGQIRDKTTIEDARERQESVEDIAPSASEVIEMKMVDIGNHHSLTSESHKHMEPEKKNEMELKDQGIGVVTNIDDNLNKNAEDQSVELVRNMGNTLTSNRFSEQQRKTEIANLDGKLKELHGVKKMEHDNIKNEINEEIMTTTIKTTEKLKSELENHHIESNEGTQSLEIHTGDEKENRQQTLDKQNANLMKAANPSDHVALNDFHLEGKHHNIDYNDSEHTATLTEMKTAENSLNHQVTILKALESNEAKWDHEAGSLNSMKTANPSGQVPLNDLPLLHKPNDNDNNESEHTATLTEMKTAENNLNNQAMILKALEDTEAEWDREARPLISMKNANPASQLPVNDHHFVHKLHNIDYNESEHTTTLSEMKTADSNTDNQVMALKALGTADDLQRIVPEPWGHETRSLISMKTADPSDKVPLNDLQLQQKHHNIDYNESEHTTTLTQMKTSEDDIQPHLKSFNPMQDADKHMFHESTQMTVMKAAQPLNEAALNDLHLQRQHQNIDYNESEHTTTLTGMKFAADHLSPHWTALPGMRNVEDNVRQPDSMNSNVNWSQEKQPLTTMKMAVPSTQQTLNRLSSKQTNQNIDHNGSEHTAPLTADMKAAEDHFNNQLSIPSTRWDHENELVPSMKTIEDFQMNRHELDQMRNSHIVDHHFTQSNIGQSYDFESSEHDHITYPHRHHNLVHSNVHDMNVHGGLPSHFHSNFRDSMEGLESEHVFRWKPSHESFRSSYAPNPISSGGAVGVFPNANTGGCGIPLLLSCSPSVVSGSLAKAHSTSYSGPSYSAPSYRTEDDFGFHNKRDTKKMHEIRNTNVLRSPTIVKQKTNTILDSKM